MPRVWSLLAAAVLPGCVLLTCRSSSAPRAAPTASPRPPATIHIAPGEPITIGVSAPLSGDAKALGTDIADAVDLAIADAGGSVNGHPVQSKRVDDGCGDPEKAVAAAHELAAISTLAGVIGPMCTIGAQAADHVYEAADVIHMLPAATRADLSAQGERYFFRTAWRDDAQAQVQARYARETIKASTVVLVDDGEPYGTTLADTFATAFAASGGRVLARERIQRGTIDFTTLVGQVKGAGPDAVVFEGLDPEGALIVKALRSGGYAGPFMAPDGVLSARDFIVPGGVATEGAIVTGGATPDPAFATRFKARFQRDPTTPFVLQAHDAVTALVRAIMSVAVDGGNGALSIDRAQLAQALRSETFAGLTGTIHFDANGDRSGTSAGDLGVVVYRVTNGRFEPAP
ncbi:MAG TPA: branched-chain amino acid ABC transporter substrate-binding protein [Dehalococcoidia bacterium]|nr:branched-chain amino acid ABC transporter substrate-binding protein [Dehalococcoidia bacterium]